MSKAIEKSEATNIISVIERAAMDPKIDIEKMERLLSMQERIMEKQAEMDCTAARAKMQPEMPPIEQRGRGHGSITYALWEDVQQAITPVLSANGFALTFATDSGQDFVKVTAILSHVGGHSVSTDITLPLDTSGSKNNVQAVGSSVSYGKRYTAGALLNLVYIGEDDDGQSAGAGPKISDAQFDELIALAEEVNADVTKFGKMLKVTSLKDLPASKLASAKDMLETKRGSK